MHNNYFYTCEYLMKINHRILGILPPHHQFCYFYALIFTNREMGNNETNRFFYSDGYRLGMEVVEKGITDESIQEVVQILFSTMDGLIGSLLQQAERSGVKVDCAKGCSWCCHQPVFGHTFELQYLANQIRQTQTPDKVDEIRERAIAKNNRVKAMEEKEMLNYKSPCPLLENNACMTYDARPMACRIYLSTRVASCLLFYSHPAEPENYPALLDFPLKAGRMLNQGFLAALKQHNRPGKEFRLEEGLSVFLKPL